MEQVCKASSVYQTHFLQMMSFNVLNKPVSTRPTMLMFQTKVFVLVYQHSIMHYQYHQLLLVEYCQLPLQLLLPVLCNVFMRKRYAFRAHQVMVCKMIKVIHMSSSSPEPDYQYSRQCSLWSDKLLRQNEAYKQVHQT